VQNLLFAEIVKLPWVILSSVDLNYFNGGMFNFVQAMWNFRKISGEILMKISRESFVKRIQTLVPKYSGNFRVKFWRRFRCRNTIYNRYNYPLQGRVPTIKNCVYASSEKISSEYLSFYVHI